jgi:Flp pilus assembly pilin Flp
MEGAAVSGLLHVYSGVRVLRSLVRRWGGGKGTAMAGQGLVEFALVILLLAVATIAIITLVGPGIEDIMRQVAEFINRR